MEMASYLQETYAMNDVINGIGAEILHFSQPAVK